MRVLRLLTLTADGQRVAVRLDFDSAAGSTC